MDYYIMDTILFVLDTIILVLEILIVCYYFKKYWSYKIYYRINNPKMQSKNKLILKFPHDNTFMT